MINRASVTARNNVIDNGQGETLLFAHGYGCDQQVWRHVAPAFSGYQTVLFDHVGAGGSDLTAFNPYKYRSLEGYASDVLALCDELQLQNVTLIGHSVSAVIGMIAVLKRPNLFSRLVMVAPSPCYVNQEDYVGGFTLPDIEGLLELLDNNHLGWSAAMAPVIMGNAQRPELTEELAGSFCRMDPTIARHFARVTFLSNNLQDLPKVSIPTLILQCADDAIAPSSVGRYMRDVMPTSRLVMMKASGHCPHLSAPEETIAEIKSFLNVMP